MDNDKIDLNDPRVKLTAIILGIVLLAAGVVWFFIENGKYDGYQPVEAYVTSTYYFKARKGRDPRSSATVTYTVDGREYKTSVDLHCGQRDLPSYKNTNIEVYYDPKNPANAVSKYDKNKFPVLQVVMALAGLAMTALGIILKLTDRRSY